MTRQSHLIKTVFLLLCVFLVTFPLSGCSAPSSSNPTAQVAKPEVTSTTLPATQAAPVQTATETAPTAQILPTDPPTQPVPTNTIEAVASTPSGGDLLKGIGIMGDSFFDEYQGSDRRGGDYFKNTFNAVELLAGLRGFNFGEWGDYPEPRRKGFEYNWARSGATSTSLIKNGQHTGLAEQVRQGKVTFVLIDIGANDFSPYYGSFYEMIYSNEMSDRSLQRKIDRAISDVTLAVDTILAAGPRGVVVTLFTQWDLDPSLPERYPNAAGRKRVSDSIDAVNEGIRAMAKSRKVVLMDQNAFGEKLLPQLEDNRYLNLGGERIDFLTHGDEPHHSRLGDKQHLGTLMSGVSANQYFINTLNEYFGTNISPLTDEEILKAAGLR